MEKDRERGQEPDTSQLFLVRLWKDETGGGDGRENKAHGKVQHVITGKAASFDDLPALVDLLMGMAPPANGIGDGRPGNTP